MLMILSATISAIFFYFILFIVKLGYVSAFYFAISAFVVHFLYKKKHFKTAQLNLFFLYAISLLFWLKGYPSYLMVYIVYLLSSAGLLFCVSDLFSNPRMKFVLKWLAWITVGISISLMMHVRFNNWLLSSFVGAIVIPIALRDKEHGEENKDRP